jgi:hypothetical protein
MRVVRVLEAVGAAAVEPEDDVTPTLAVTCGEGGFAVDLVTTDTRRHPELVVGAGTCLRALGRLDAVARWGGWREALPPFLAIRELESTVLWSRDLSRLGCPRGGQESGEAY